MKSFNGRLMKSFVWIVGVGFLTIFMVSIHEMVVRQRVKMQVIAPQQHTLLHSLDIPTSVDLDLHDSLDTVLRTNDTKTEKNTAVRQTQQAHSMVTAHNALPTTHVGFLKVHKAASTTTQAIFLRFGWRRNLTFILPPEYNKFGYPNIISINESLTQYNILKPPPGQQFDILCHHVVYGETEWDTFLPPDSKFVGTVREPFRLFKSTLNYFDPRSLKAALAKFPEDPVGAYLKNPKNFESGKNIRYSFTNNRLAFEYGVPPEVIENRDFIAFNKYLHQVLDKRFEVVIIAEQFDESLVMLKRKLNWELNDILYAIKNVRSVSKEDRYATNDEHKLLHREFATFDYLLYEFFEWRMRQQIKQAGQSFIEEVNNFKEVRTYVENFCHSGPKNVGAIRVHKSAWNKEFDISKADCDIMHKGEIQFTQMIRIHQYGSATWKGPGQKPVPAIINNKPKQANR